MSKFAKLSHIDTQNDFALLMETNGRVQAVGVSKVGREWVRWFTKQPTAQFQTLADVFPLLGDQISVSENRRATRDDRAAFGNAVKQLPQR